MTGVGEGNRRRYYLVAEEILPEAMLKTVQVKTLLASGEVERVHDAVSQVGLSRSAFYKYRDLVHLYDEEGREHVVTLSLILEHRTGVLSVVLDAIARAGGNVLTINQGMPVHQAALVTVMVDVSDMTNPVDALVKTLVGMTGVRRAEIVGYSQ
ncbi:MULTISPECIES: ACT domain-containing protein [Kyrpidia]|uniref:ACT domain-containing protein n=1 Tax=Kyrpidia TaxID=1129704 RepID=UPI0014754651|nr:MULTISPECIES: ACT domain-containing protein [Kyrpidia]MCL6576041.1 ACT domain-containing protein [Kyrpidia sp.]